ncbi:hypothetical protein C7974DRAFT_321106 [Boeremia exigua]|uniref:uncharacterized protein n=1 Tax=Boeremia exigua TaxID=749465 RepID=UPI001E8D92B8|nr:uncharacterized protein C7974DRAFT_321106 [Boeremia exigua]KAH6614143.1 hypothetical protein C7974DRAFT_321106 [Boeremia exigua]
MAALKTLQTLTISTALLTSGGIATLSLFDIPMLRSQPASRSLPLLRWLFSRGSHTAPTGILLSSTGFLALAYTSLPASSTSPWTSIFSSSTLSALTQGKPALYLTAATLSLFAALFTRAMLPTNFALIELNEALGGSKSAASATYRERVGAQPRSALESVQGKEDVGEWEGSGPQAKTRREASEEEEQRVRELLGRFGGLNLVRAGLVGVGGVVGLVCALG